MRGTTSFVTLMRPPRTSVRQGLYSGLCSGLCSGCVGTIMLGAIRSSSLVMPKRRFFSTDTDMVTPPKKENRTIKRQNVSGPKGPTGLPATLPPIFGGREGFLNFPGFLETQYPPACPSKIDASLPCFLNPGRCEGSRVACLLRGCGAVPAWERLRKFPLSLPIS